MHIKQKSTNKKQNKNKQTKNNKSNSFPCSKTWPFVLLFLKKNWNCLDNLYYTTELCSLDLVAIKLLLPIYQHSKYSIYQDKQLLTHGTFKNIG